jgi:hypothetical protein
MLKVLHFALELTDLERERESERVSEREERGGGGGRVSV